VLVYILHEVKGKSVRVRAKKT